MPTQITVARAEPGLLPHFPDVVRLADGRLLAAWRESTGHVKADGRIRLAESDDNGKTWSAPRTAVDGPFDDRDPKLAVLRDGTVLLSYFVIEWTEPWHTTHGTWVHRSTDNGETWGEPILVGTAMALPEQERRASKTFSASHGAAAELPSGDLLFPLYGRLPGEAWMRATVVRSTDGGRTWPAESEILLAAADGVHFQEPTLTVLDDRVIVLIRTTVGHAYLAESTDDGHTWSIAQPTDMPASSHHALRLSTGEVLVTYGDLKPRFSEHRDTVGRLVRDPEKGWDGYEDVQLYDSGHSDQANPSSVELEPGRFLTLGFDVRAATVVGIFTETKDYPQ
ncbi:sialidase family protein [Actinoplanes sp. NPDC048796]|uniref:sialidase family protein n=1 Tax=Actinoplanes sp. NPDC048796 TaxID=3155640 RepID=UPI0033D4E27D